MRFCYAIDLVIKWIKRKYRKAVFRECICCPHSDFRLVGDITVINRNIKLGHNVTIYPDVMFFGDGPIQIGDNVDIGNGTIFYSSQNGGGIVIGNNTMIAAQSYIIDTDHGIRTGTPMRDQENTVLPVFIGEDVWIAAGCKVLKGTKINDGAIIGAASVVKGEIPSNAIAVGAPAKVKRYRGEI